MGDKTSISWTDASWNPIVGCSIVSPGCTNCYAMQQAERIQRMNDGKPSHYDGTTKVVNGNPVWTGLMRQAPEHILLQPLKWKRPRKIFVNSMSDLFHEDVPDEWIDRVFAVMALCPQHTFQVLTKRSKRMREYFWCPDDGEGHLARWATIAGKIMADGDGCSAFVRYRPWPLPNVWLGVSCEDQLRADDRSPDLLETPAVIRFVSVEPQLGPIDFTKLVVKPKFGDGWCFNALEKNNYLQWRKESIDWIIVGGESGPGHRPMNIEWAEAIREQCEAAGTAFFFKQDSGSKPGQRGRVHDELWACKQFPHASETQRR
jgi:protein gp37